MVDGYKPLKQGVDSHVGWMKGVERQLAALRSTAGILSSVIGKGGITVKDGGGISLLDGGQIEMSTGGKFFVAGDDTYVQILDDSFSIGTVGPDRSLTRPSMIMQPDGFLAAISDTLYAVFRIDPVTGAAVVTSSQGSVRLPYQTTGSAANTRILLDGTIQMVTSSRRYKRDVNAAVIDIADVLKLRGRTWRQRSEVADDPETDTRYIGFIAEELDALPSMRQFVDYDEQGRPDAIQYDRLTVALLELLKHVHGLMGALTSRVDELEIEAERLRTTVTDMQSQMAAMAARLDALESRTETY